MNWFSAVAPEVFDARLIAQDVELYSALHFIGQAGTDREYAVERHPLSGLIQILSGMESSVVYLGDLILHTHCEEIAVPSLPDLEAFDQAAEERGHTETFIYSCPAGEHQLSHILRRQPGHFDVHFYRYRPQQRPAGVIRYFQFETGWTERDRSHQVESYRLREFQGADKVIYEDRLDIAPTINDLLSQGKKFSDIQAAVEGLIEQFWHRVL